MKTIPLLLPGCMLIQPPHFPDTRGYFQELWSAEHYAAIGLTAPFVQDNFSQSKRGVVRGMHYQRSHPQGKLISVLSGEIYDVMVDIRRHSPRFGQWQGIRLHAEQHTQLWIPPGFAHGFQAISDHASVLYKTTQPYTPTDEASFAYNDPSLAITWPIHPTIVSEKDQNAPSFNRAINERR